MICKATLWMLPILAILCTQCNALPSSWQQVNPLVTSKLTGPPIFDTDHNQFVIPVGVVRTGVLISKDLNTFQYVDVPELGEAFDNVYGVAPQIVVVPGVGIVLGMLGTNSVVTFSSDGGNTWSKPYVVPGYYDTLIAGNGLFVILSTYLQSNITYVTSKDGVNWKYSTFGVESYLEAQAWRFVAGQFWGYTKIDDFQNQVTNISTTKDFETFENFILFPASDWNLQLMSIGEMSNGSVVAAIYVYEGEPDYLSFFVKTGNTWVNASTIQAGYLNSDFQIVTGNGVSILGEQLITSDWITFENLGDYLPIIDYGIPSYAKDRFFVTYNPGEIGYSMDAKEWSFVDEGIAGTVMNMFSFEGQFVMNAILDSYFTDGVIYTSNDGTNWELYGDNFTINDLYFDQELKQLVGFDYGNIYYGADLESLKANVITGPAGLGTSSIAFGNNKWVLTTNNRVGGMHPYYAGEVWTMELGGTSWTYTTGYTGQEYEYVYDVVFFDGTFYVATYYGLLISTDGIHWGAPTAGAPNLVLSFSQAIGDTLYMYTIADLVYMIEASNTTNYQLVNGGTPFSAIIGSDTQPYLATAKDTLYTSTDGIHFTKSSSISTDGIIYNFLAYNSQSTFVAVGTNGDPSSYNNIMYVSN